MIRDIEVINLSAERREFFAAYRRWRSELAGEPVEAEEPVRAKER
jgi:hypothetical protein